MTPNAPQVAAPATLEAAREYVRRGWAVVPIPRGSKAPIIPGWPSLRLCENDLPRYFATDRNIGVLLGAPSGGLADLDLDAPETAVVADFLLPPTGFLYGRASKPHSHRFYISDPPPVSRKFCDLDGTAILELRSTGQQSVVPPSLHPSGEFYTFNSNGEPARIKSEELVSRIRLVAAAALLARHWPAPGARHDAALALAGMLLRAGWTEEATSVFILAVTTAAQDEEQRGRVRNVASTAKRLVAGRTATGAPTLATIIGDEVVRRVREWVGVDTSVEIPSATPSPVASSWPEPLADEAFYGLAGEIVRAIEPHSEADPAALLLQLLATFGNVIGNGPFFVVEQHRHHANLFVLIVGITSKSRKGTSWSRIAALVDGVDPIWVSNRVHGGIGSGEGIIWSVRDPILKGEKLLDEGSSDKRLMILETEFALVLAVIKREGSTVSEILRRAWDGTPLQTLTKNSPTRATGAHVSLVGHITREELLRHLDATEVANGFINRFILCCVRRSKALPEGGIVSDDELRPLIERLRGAVSFAHDVGEMRRDQPATALWREVYPQLSEGKPGLLGAVISRAEAQVLRLSMVYALLDCSAVIRREHLLAALAVWDYAESSARYIFGDALGDPVADEIVRALRAKPEGLTRSEIRDLFGRNRSSGEISRALGVLLRSGLADYHSEQSGGRPVERWFVRRPPYDLNDLNDKSRLGG
jgi:hypothetical protein